MMSQVVLVAVRLHFGQLLCLYTAELNQVRCNAQHMLWMFLD